MKCLITLLLCSLCGFAQTRPKNLKQAVKYLDKEFPAYLKNKIKTTRNDSLIYLVSPWGGENNTLSNWLEDSLPQHKLVVYFEKKGIDIPKSQMVVILQAFKQYLNTGSFNKKQILLPFQAESKRIRAQEAVKYTTDTLNGVYIPKNLDDCYARLDVIWKDDAETKKKKITENMHLSLGLWMRNNWGLWQGSRLSEYFNNIGIYHPDDMSGIILDGYESYLNDTVFDLDSEVQQYQAYWKKGEDDQKAKEIEAFAAYKVGQAVYFKYNYGYVTKDEEEKYNAQICIAQGVVVEKDSTNLNIRVQLVKACDTKGIIAYDNINSLTYNKKTDSFEKPKKRKILKMKEGKIFWFHYSEWDPEDN